ncbi:MAG TPA: shikimate kinase [Anaerovoracaceae bacterium]|nr:shikimate kinase [Anaerovoracaceae bacterium]
MSRKYGLLGRTLKHSFSKKIHNILGDYSYELIEVPNIKNLEEVIKSKDYKGFNVTIPYKIDVIEFCDILTKEAKLAQAVNTLYYERGKVVGHNTDVEGVLYLLRKAGSLKKVIILGSGGASGAVKAALEIKGVYNYVIISRNGKDNYSNMNNHLDADAIINTTPVGMYPNNGKSPLENSDVNLESFTKLESVIDIIYNPNKTKLLLDAEKIGVKTISGMGMLVAQAIKSAEAWGVLDKDDLQVEKINNKILKKTQNIMLIGMPGCGKSTVAKGLSNLLDRPYIDLDRKVVEGAKMSISDIFDNPKMGEKYFRKLETETLRELSKKDGYIIATGGGVVISDDNFDLLKENSICIYIKRELKLLSKNGRPISKRKGVDSLYKERSHLYEKLADITVENNRDFEGSYYKELKNYSQKIKNEIDKFYQV